MTQLRLTTIFMLTLPLLMVAFPPAQATQSMNDSATIAEVKQETADLLNTIKSYSAAQRDEAVQAIEIAIQRVDDRIASLEKRTDNQWDEMTGSARTQARANLRALQQQRIKLAEWYGGLKDSSSGAWEDIKRGFSRAYDDINRAWEKALKNFNDSSS